MRITIYDIAKELNLTASTVSRALNNKPGSRIPVATRERVLKAAEVMGYRPSKSARALTTGKTSNIALLVSTMQERTGPHFTRMLAAVEPAARNLNYSVTVCSGLESVLGDGNVDGVLVLADPRKCDYASRLEGSPCVYVWNTVDLVPNCAAWSDFAGAEMAGRYLLDQGHAKVAAIMGDTFEIQSKSAGFRKAMESIHGRFYECTGMESDDPFQNGYLLTRKLLSEVSDVTAIFGRNDIYALGAMKALRESGLSVPDDVSVIGYNDTLLAHCSTPGLTSVRTPIEEAGVQAVNHLVKRISGEETEFAGILLPVTLTIRNSCGAIRQEGINGPPEEM